MKNETKKGVNLTIALIGLVVILVVLFLVGLFINRPAPEVIQGEAEATEVRVSAKVPGRIETIMVKEGQVVRMGDTLAIIDSPELNAKLDQATSARAAAEAQNEKAIKGARPEQKDAAYEMWQKAVAGVDIAKKSFDRVANLFEKGVTTAQKYDEAQAQYNAAVATERAALAQYRMAQDGAENEDKQSAKALVGQATGAVEEVESYIRERTIISPIDGTISEIYPNRGELVGTGSPVMSVVDLNDQWITFNVREDLLNDLNIGTVISVKIPALENKTVGAKVTYIKALASYATWKATKTNDKFDAKTFEVKAVPTANVEGLLPGMSAVMVETGK